MKNTLLLLLSLAFCARAAGPSDDPLADLTRRSMKSVVLVRNEMGCGSGFLAQYGSQKCLFTNQHVVASGVSNTFTLSSQAQVRVGTAAAAVDHDIIAYGIAGDTEVLEVMFGVDRFVTIGDEVAVLGNPDGLGVIHPLTGKVVGIGPQLIEISAEFVPGNSGSPVVHLKSGKIIAVATYLRFEKADFTKGKMTDQVRRFCYRLDSIKQWERVRWNDFQDDAETVTRVHRRTLELFAVLTNSGNLGGIATEAIRDQEIQTVVKRYQERLPSAVSKQDRNIAAESLVRDLSSAATSDMEHARRRITYDHFTKMLAAEMQLREPVTQALEIVRTRLIGQDAEAQAAPTAESRRNR
jgi:hypothetical protein